LYYYIYYIILLVSKWFLCRVIIDENVNTKNRGYYYNILFFIMAILYSFFNTFKDIILVWKIIRIFFPNSQPHASFLSDPYRGIYRVGPCHLTFDLPRSPLYAWAVFIWSVCLFMCPLACIKFQLLMCMSITSLPR